MKIQIFEERLEEIRETPSTIEGAKALKTIVLSQAYVEEKLAAAETAAQRFLDLFKSWTPIASIAGGTVRQPRGERHDANAFAFLELLLGWLPVPENAGTEELCMTIEKIVLEALLKADPRIPWDDESQFFAIEALERVMAYCIKLVPQHKALYGAATTLWCKFLASSVLDVRAVALMANHAPQEFANRLPLLVDRACAWLAKERQNDEALHLIGQYGGRETQRVVRERFWMMVVRAARLASDPAEKDRIAVDPIGHMSAAKTRTFSNRVFVAHLVLAARLDGPTWRTVVSSPPAWFAEEIEELGN